MRFILSFILLILGSCSSPPSIGEITMHKIQAEHGSDQFKKRDLLLIGSGLSFPEKIRAHSVIFWAKGNVTIEEARRLLIEGCEDLLAITNTHTELIPLFSNFPFEGKNLNYDIFFFTEPYKPAEEPYVTMVANAEGRVYYTSYLKGFPREIHCETYEEALQIVKNSLRPHFTQ